MSNERSEELERKKRLCKAYSVEARKSAEFPSGPGLSWSPRTDIEKHVLRERGKDQPKDRSPRLKSSVSDAPSCAISYRADS